MDTRVFLVATISGSEYLVLTRDQGQRLAVPLLAQLKGGNRREEEGLAIALPRVGENLVVYFGDRRLRTSIVKGVREL